VAAEDLPWEVAVDDLAGTVHQVFGGLADPSYLIDVDGRVAFYNLWTHAPTLHRAISALVRQGGRGTVDDGLDRGPHLLPALTDGWRGLRRGLPRSLLDMETTLPLSGVGLWAVHQLRPILAPFTLRARPLRRWQATTLGIGGLAAVAALGWAGARLGRRVLSK